MTQTATITGIVEYREGDGPMSTIRPGLVELQVTPEDVTIGWEDGDTRNATAIPTTDFDRFVEDGAIRLED